MIPGSVTPLLLKKAAVDTGYNIERSLRFNSSDSAYLSRTPASAGNRKTWTWAGWVKRSGSWSRLFAGGSALFSNPVFTAIGFDGDKIVVNEYNYPSAAWGRDSVAVFRDYSAWYHIVVAVDTTQATDTNRVKLYVNGVAQDTVTRSTYSAFPAQNADTYINTTTQHQLSASNGTNSSNFYLADVHFIDGQALDPTSFTEVSATTGQLIPKAYTGSFGTNGFWLKFSDNSAATATTLGKDYSGNSNNWTPNNLNVSTGNQFSVYGLVTSSGQSITNIGSLTLLQSSAKYYDSGATNVNCLTADFGSVSTWTLYSSLFDPSFGSISISDNGTSWTSVSTGQKPFIFTGRYIQFAKSGSGFNGAIFDTQYVEYLSDSVKDSPFSAETDNCATWNPLTGASSLISDGNLRVDGSGGSNAGQFATIAISSGKFYWEYSPLGYTGYCGIGIAEVGTNISSWVTNNNNTSGNVYGVRWDGQKYSLATGYQSYTTAGLPSLKRLGIAFDATSGTLEMFINGVSQGVMFSGIPTSKTYTPILYAQQTPGFWWGEGTWRVNFGQYSLAYLPTGYKALCTANLPAPVVAKPSEVMDVALYSGNSGTQSISGLGFSPDLVWLKCRNDTYGHRLLDTVRGATIALASQATAAEFTESTGLTAFNSDGFTLGSNVTYNESAKTYVAWTWDAGSSTVTNTQGSITSQVRANASAGFSIVTYTGTGSAATVGHGLNAVPKMILAKRRTGGVQNWLVLLSEKLGHLDLTNAMAAYNADNGFWNNTLPTSSVFSIGYYHLANDYVAYCFAPVAGYTSAGSYTGNGSADGPFVYTSMRPRWILLKRTDSTGNWTILDTAREGYNVDNDPLFPNLANAEGTTDLADILSNGFKLRSTDASVNASGGTYIYYAISEMAFQYSRAR